MSFISIQNCWDQFHLLNPKEFAMRTKLALLLAAVATVSSLGMIAPAIASAEPSPSAPEVVQVVGSVTVCLWLPFGSASIGICI